MYNTVAKLKNMARSLSPQKKRARIEEGEN
jgi:hypothetical protein